MKTAADWLMVCLAVAAVVLLGAGVLPSDVPGIAGQSAGNALHFHPGKNPRTVPAAAGCLASGCHSGSPHKRDPGLAPFRNMHTAYVDCLVCHAADGIARSAGRQAGSGRRHLGYAGAPVSGPKGHPALGSPSGCRRCHSDAGVGVLKARGLQSLPSNFTDPIALRMYEGGARRWNP